MRRYLLDTGIASHYMNRRKGVYLRAQAEVQKGNFIGVCVPVLAELHYGAENSQSSDRNLKLLRRTLKSWRIWPVTLSTAMAYGRLAAHLHQVGRPMQQFDILIATTALDLGNCTVVSMDTDFDAVEGLDVENWAI